MNDDEIERLLRELPESELPASWRAEILSAARREFREETRTRREWPPILLWLRDVLSRNPITASALAILWLLIFLFHTTTPVDLQEREIIAQTDLSQPIHLITMADEIRLVDLAEQTSAQPRPVP
jgi:hypothetical protein